LFDWSYRRFQASAFRSIGLGNYQTDVESGGGEFFERRDCEVGRAAENELKGGRHSVIEQSGILLIEPPVQAKL